MPPTAEHLPVARIACGTQVCTAFCVAPGVVLTARHALVDRLHNPATEIFLTVAAQSCTCEIHEVEIPVEYDLVLLRMTGAMDLGPLEVETSYLVRNLPWFTRGFPIATGTTPRLLHGKVLASNLVGAVSDSQLQSDAPDGTNLEGFSGAPVIVGGRVRAVLQYQDDFGLGSVSIHRIRAYLEQAGVEVRHKETPRDLPATLLNSLEHAVPNYPAHAELEESLVAKAGYVLLVGKPGSGKSLIAAGFSPQSTSIKVVGRYFLGSDQPLPYRHQAQGAVFALWLVDMVSLRISGAVVPDAGSDPHELTQAIEKNLSALAASASNEASLVLVVDGLEPQAAERARDFVDALPRSLPPNVSIVFTAASAEVFRVQYPDIEVAAVVEVPPLSVGASELVVWKGANAPTRPDVIRLAAASDGHPLLLSYIVAAFNKSGSADDAIQDAQQGIDAYHASIWRRFTKTPAGTWVLAMLAESRGPLTETQLGAMAPADVILQVPDALRALAHLTRGDPETGLEYYHSSLPRFISSQTGALGGMVREALADFCLAKEDYYAVKNRVYHCLRAPGHEERGANRCNQEWLNSTAMAGLAPEFALSDIDEALQWAIERGNFQITVRLLLLRARAAYRYDFLFAGFALPMARLALRIYGGKSALGYAIRNGVLLLDPEDTATLVRDAMVYGEYDAAQAIFENARAALFSGGGFRVEHLPALIDLLAQSFAWAPTRAQRDLRLIHATVEEADGPPEKAASRMEMVAALQWGDMLWRTKHLVLPRTISTSPAKLAQHAGTAFYLAEAIFARHGDSLWAEEYPPLPQQLELISAANLGVRVADGLGDVVLDADTARLVAELFLRTGTGRDSAVFRMLVAPRTKFSLRNPNGVDLDWTSFNAARWWVRVGSYFGQVDRGAVRVLTRHDWERRLSQALLDLTAVDGGLSAGTSGVEPEAAVRSILKLITFDLAERATWEDAYAIPEELVPAAFGELFPVVRRFLPSTAMSLVMEWLNGPAQSGLYSEGFVGSLVAAGAALRVIPATAQAAVLVYKTLWDHLRTRVFARTQRVQMLLECAISLFDMEESELAIEIAREALASSNGPHWYKEDQFSLLTDALEMVDDRDVSRRNWQDVVRTLEYASGECTFQRYVRTEKESLLDHLMSVGLLGEALALYRFYNDPSLQVQVERIAREAVDSVAAGVGNRFGVNEVQDQVVATSVVKHCGASPRHRWAMIELFLPCGSDRTTQELVRLAREVIDADSNGQLLVRAARVMWTDLEPGRRDELVGQLAQDGWPAQRLVELVPAWKASYKAPAKAKRERDEPLPDFIVPGRSGPWKALDSLKAVKQRNATAGEVVRALREAKEGGWDLWLFEPDFKWGLSRLFDAGITDGTRAFGGLVTCAPTSAGDWRSAAELITHAARHLDPATRELAFEIVRDHVQHILAPETTYLSHPTVPESIGVSSGDAVVEDLLVGYLDHPNQYLRSRAAELILWLAEQSVELPLKLAARVREDRVGYGRELAAAMLTVLPGSEEHRGSLAAAIRSSPTPDLFVIAALEYGTANPSPRSVPAPGPQNSLVKPQISLDTSGFAGALEGVSVHELAGLHMAARATVELPVGMQLTLWSHRCRANYADNDDVGAPLERIGVGLAVADESREALLDRHALWNPEWPERRLDLSWSSQAERILRSLNQGHFSEAFVRGPEVILHALEIIVDQDGESRTFEAAAVVLDRNRYLRPFRAGEVVRYAAHFGESLEGADSQTGAWSAVVRYRPAYRVGGDLTPSRVSAKVRAACGADIGGRRSLWRSRRDAAPQSVGPATLHGVVTTAEANRLAPLKPSLAWIVWFGGTIKLIDPVTRRVLDLPP